MCYKVYNGEYVPVSSKELAVAPVPAPTLFLKMTLGIPVVEFDTARAAIVTDLALVTYWDVLALP